MEIQNTVAVVTGAGGGIGGAIARALSVAGVRVVLTDLDSDAVARTAEAIIEAGGQAIALAGDASDNAHIDDVPVSYTHLTLPTKA